MLMKSCIFFKFSNLDGNWGPWGAWSTCTATCNGGAQTHTRLCNNPAPSNGGATCSGSGSEIAICNITPCGTGKFNICV